jgi:hypothetical protein
VPKIIGVENGSIGAQDQLVQKKGTFFSQTENEITYIILGDDLNDRADNISLTSGLPSLFYPSYGGFCKSRKFTEETQIINPNTGVMCGLWSVECHFDSSMDDEDNEEDPTSLRPRTWWSGDSEDVHLEFDAIDLDPFFGGSFKQVVNAVGEPLFIETQVIQPILNIKRYEHFPFDPNVMLDYAHQTNATSFWGAPPGTALCLPMETSEETIINKVRLIEVTYKIKFRIRFNPVTGAMEQDTWKAKVLNCGTKYRPTAGAEPVAAKDKTGHPITVNLSIDGTKLPPGLYPDYLEFNRHTKVDFNNLSLGPF